MGRTPGYGIYGQKLMKPPVRIHSHPFLHENLGIHSRFGTFNSAAKAPLRKASNMLTPARSDSTWHGRSGALGPAAGGL